MPLSESADVDVKRPAARQGNFLRKSKLRRRWGVLEGMRVGLGCDGGREGGVKGGRKS